MKSPHNAFVLAYWNSLRRGRDAPDQSEIEPNRLRRILPCVFLLEARADGGFAYRLAGTSICRRYGSELRGQDFLQRWDEEHRARVAELLSQSLQTAVPVCVTATGITERLALTIETETVLMPTTSGGPVCDRFLCASHILIGEIGWRKQRILSERLMAALFISNGASGDSGSAAQ